MFGLMNDFKKDHRPDFEVTRRIHNMEEMGPHTIVISPAVLPVHVAF
jgi:hypothetical protein